MLIYVIFLQSDCFKVQGHLVPRLNPNVDLVNMNARIRQEVKPTDNSVVVHELELEINRDL